MHAFTITDHLEAHPHVVCDTSTASVNNLCMSVALAQWKKHPHRHRCCLMIAVGEAVEGYRLHDIGGVYWITCRHWRFMQCAPKWLDAIEIRLELLHTSGVQPW